VCLCALVSVFRYSRILMFTMADDAWTKGG